MPFSAAWWNAPAFYPAPGVLELFGEPARPEPASRRRCSGSAPDRRRRTTSCFCLTFPLSALGAYLLVYELTRRHDAAFIAGLLFGFAPYRIAHLPQIQSLASFPMPFALLGLHRYLRLSTHAHGVTSAVEGRDSRRNGSRCSRPDGFCRAICNGYYLLFFSVFVGLWMLWFASPWRRPRAFLAIGVGVGWWRRYRCCRCCCVIARFTRRSDSRAISGPSETSAPMSRASFTRPITSRSGDGSKCFDVRKESCFRVSR